MFESVRSPLAESVKKGKESTLSLTHSVILFYIQYQTLHSHILPHNIKPSHTQLYSKVSVYKTVPLWCHLGFKPMITGTDP